MPKLHGVNQNLTSELGIYQLSIKMTVDRQFQVSSGCELLSYLTGLPLGLSRKQAKDLFRFRAVTVKGKATVRHDTELMHGDVVTIAARKQVSGAALERHGLAIVHLDDAVVVVEKPAGLLSMGSEREKEKTAYRILNTHLKALMKTPAQQVFVVHRLDRETSGLMMFARSSHAFFRCRAPSYSEGVTAS